VQRICDLLNHAITVRSWPGHGSVFAIEVPRAEDRQSLPGRMDRATATTCAGAVLIIEDDPAVRYMLEMLLQDDGLRTAAVTGADAALALAARRDFVPDVIIADYNLPGDLTGAAVITRLRTALRTPIPGIILTGDISSDTLRQVGQAGCVYLSKPVAAEVLIQRVHGLIAGSRQPDARTAERAPEEAGGTVFVVDDDHSVLDELQRLLQEHGHRVEAYASCEAFVAADRPERAGCLVVDAIMPGMGGIALLEQLKAANRSLPAIVITGQGDISMAVQAMKAGAGDFLEKPIRAHALLATIERALAETRDVTQLAARQRTAAQRIAHLTPRERDVLDLVVQGRANKLIAEALQISQRTVENHRAAVMRRTGSRSLPDLIRLVMVAGDATLPRDLE
jgi:two-component system CheB/CheR fusion protein